MSEQDEHERGSGSHATPAADVGGSLVQVPDMALCNKCKEKLTPCVTAKLEAALKKVGLAAKKDAKEDAKLAPAMKEDEGDDNDGANADKGSHENEMKVAAGDDNDGANAPVRLW